jgi:hypothetical protein
VAAVAVAHGLAAAVVAAEFKLDRTNPLLLAISTTSSSVVVEAEPPTTQEQLLARMVVNRV